ncbi:MAG: hypothetical protein AAFX06_02170 [Planctomycetota bacterium]
MRWIFKPFPYIGIFLGACWLMQATSVMTQDKPEGPVKMSLADLERSSADNLPEWVHIADGIPYWPEAGAVYREKDGKRTNEKLLVPLLSEATRRAWPNTSSDLGTGFLLEFSWDELRFADSELARAFAPTATEEQLAEHLAAKELTPFPVSFDPIESDVAYLILSGAEKMAVEEMKNAGFRDVIIVRPGSKPLTSEEAPALAVVGMLFTLGGVYWIYRRCKKRPQPLVDSTVSAGFQRGAEEALQTQVSAGIRGAIEQHRQRQPST